jgi:hypothetical protein
MAEFFGFSATRPGTSMARLHRPFFPVSTNACDLKDPSKYCPPTAQLPPAAHDTDVTVASLPALAGPTAPAVLAVLAVICTAKLAVAVVDAGTIAAVIAATATKTLGRIRSPAAR